MSAISYKKMGEEHLSEALVIEKESFEFPWDRGDFVEAIEALHHYCLGIFDGFTLVGYVVYYHDPGVKPLVATILNFAIKKSRRREGIASYAICKPFMTLRADVWEKNLVGQLFFRSLGFRVVAINRGDYAIEGIHYRDSYTLEFRVNEETKKAYGGFTPQRCSVLHEQTIR